MAYTQHAVSILALSCVPLAAQKTWVVDAAGGSGSNFRDLPAAVKAASAGDVLLVRKGSYTAPLIDKGLRIVGTAGATIRTDTMFPETPLRIQGIPSTQMCTLDGFTLQGRNGEAVIVVSGNKGVVVLRLLAVGYSAAAGTQSISISKSDAVSLHQCAVDMGLRSDQSTVSIFSSIFSRRFASFPINGSRPALRIERSDVTLARVSATGQRGFKPYLQSMPALWCASSNIRILGDATSVYQAGTDQSSTPRAALIGSSNSTLVIDDRVSLRPIGTAPGHRGFTTVQTRRQASLGATGGSLGASVVLELWSKPNHPFALLASLPGKPIRVPPLGTVWFDPSTLVLAGTGTQGTSGTLTRTLAVPNRSTLRGLPILWQAISGPAGASELTNPAVTTLR